MPTSSTLTAIARAYMERERQRLGIPKQEQDAEAAQTSALLRRAQAAQIGREIELAPAKQESQIALEGAQVRQADAHAEYYRTPKQPAPPNIGSFEDFVVQKFGSRPTPDQITQARKVYQQADDRAPTTIITPTGESNILNRLVAQWDKAITPARDLSRQAKLMETGLAAARRGDLAAGSQAVLVTFQKILDPTSVVRESEYARSAAGQSMMARVEGIRDRLMQGGAGVPLPELEKFAQLANEMVSASTGDYTRAVKSRIGRTADHYKIKQDLIFDEHDFSAEANPVASVPGPAAGSVEFVRDPATGKLVRKQ